jgi:hypothetical protein
MSLEVVRVGRWKWMGMVVGWIDVKWLEVGENGKIVVGGDGSGLG